MTTSGSYPPDPYPHGSVVSRSFLPLALITLGVVFLLGNLVPERARDGLFVLGLGAAFMIGRLTTGRQGYAVPAGILIAIGTFITLEHTAAPAGIGGAGLFFVLLGLGFVLAYAINMRPSMIWPLFPAAVLLFLGLIFVGVASLGPLASLSWIVGFWPAALVLVGVWFLLRDSLPYPVRRPIATVGGIGLLGYGIVAAAAAMASGGASVPVGAPQALGGSPFTNTYPVDAPIAAGQTFTVSNSSGRTTIHTGETPAIHVVATRHFTFGRREPEVRLVPTEGGVKLDATSTRGFPFGDSTWVDYTIDVPADVAVKVQGGSGEVEIDGVTGAVDATTTSGSIRGTQLQHLHQAQTRSGYISLEGIFTDPAEIKATSGTVNVKLLPGSAVQLDAHTNSGTIQPMGLTNLIGPNATTRRDTLTGVIGTPAQGAKLSIQTSSGSILISE